MFFTNGAIFASVVPRYPDLKAQLGLSNAALGSAVSAFWLGALIVGLVGGAVVSRWGSGRVATVVTVGASVNLVAVGLSRSWWALAGALFVAGSFDTVADIAENAQALRVEGLYHRSILNSLHGVWSIGAVTGGAAGTVAAGAHVPLPVHLTVTGIVSGLIAVTAARFLLPGRDPRMPGPGAASRSRGARRRIRLVAGIAVLGVLATLAQAIEDTGSTWSAVYLRDGLGAAPAVSGLGFVALQVMQTVGRLLGDRTVTRWGDRAVARGGAALAGLSMGAALTFPSPLRTVAAFGAVGLGIATLMPATMRHADALPGLPPGVGLSLVGSVSRIGSLTSPPLIGLLADTYTLRVGLLAVPAAAVLLILLTPVLNTNHRYGQRAPATPPDRGDAPPIRPPTH